MIFPYCHPTTQPAFIFKNIARNFCRASMTRHVYHISSLWNLHENRDPWKSQSRLRFIVTSLFTVANKKWRSIKLSQISHFSFKQSETWVRDYKGTIWQFHANFPKCLELQSITMQTCMTISWNWKDNYWKLSPDALGLALNVHQPELTFASALKDQWCLTAAWI